MTDTLGSHEVTEEEYVAAIPIIRSKFLAHQANNFDLEEALKADHGVINTYRGYLKFLELDLHGSNVVKDAEGKTLSGRQQDKVRRAIAKQMIVNGAVSIFAYVRYSFTDGT